MGRSYNRVTICLDFTDRIRSDSSGHVTANIRYPIGSDLKNWQKNESVMQTITLTGKKKQHFLLFSKDQNNNKKNKQKKTKKEVKITCVYKPYSPKIKFSSNFKSWSVNRANKTIFQVWVDISSLKLTMQDVSHSALQTKQEKSRNSPIQPKWHKWMNLQCQSSSTCSCQNTQTVPAFNWMQALFRCPSSQLHPSTMALRKGV